MLIVIERVMVNFCNNCSGRLFINSSGRNIVISDRFMEMIVNLIFCVFCNVVCKGFIFVFRWWVIFFSIIMVLLMINLVVIVSVISDRLLRLKLYRYMVVKVLMSEMGMVMVGISVVCLECRNKNIIMIISVIEIVSVFLIFCSDVWIVGEWFWVICKLIVVGIIVCSFGSFVWMLLIVWIMLVFGSLWIINKIVGLVFVILVLWIFCIELVMLVMLFRCIVVLLL